MLTRLSSALVVVLLLLPCLTSAQTWTSALTIAVPYFPQTGRLFVPAATVSDAAGNLYVAGRYTGPITLGSFSLPAGNELVVGKLDAAGHWLWVAASQTSAGTNNRCDARALALDAAGNVLVAGFLRGTASFGPHALAGPVGMFSGTTFVARLSPTGSWQWATMAIPGPGDGYCDAVQLAADGQGNAVVAGGLQGTILFGNQTCSAPQPANGVVTELFVAALDSAGHWRGANTSTGSNPYNPINSPPSLRLGRLVVDANGAATVLGSFLGTTQLGTTQLTQSTPAGSGFDTFVARLDNQMRWQWATATDGTGHDALGADLTLTPNGEMAITGAFYQSARFGTTTLTGNAAPNSTGFLAVLNAATGAWQWAVNTNGNPMITGSGGNRITANARGELLVGGGTNDTLQANYVALYSPAGAEQWRAPIAVDRRSFLGWSALELLPGDSVRITGLLAGQATFGTLAMGAPDSQSLAVAHLRVRPTGLPDDLRAAPFHLSPNPAHHTATLTGAAPCTRFTVLNALGRPVLTATADATGAAPLDVRTLPAGLYLVRADGRGGARRLVVE